MSLFIEHCSICQHPNSPNLFAICKICKRQVCFECTASREETKNFAKTVGNDPKVWDFDDEKADPPTEFRGYDGPVCEECYFRGMKVLVKRIDKEDLRRIHEDALYEIHGDKFLPFAKYLCVGGLPSGGLEGESDQEEYPQPEQETP